MAVFTKPAITPIEQLELLKDRGLIIIDEPRSLCFLQAVSFFSINSLHASFSGGK